MFQKIFLNLLILIILGIPCITKAVGISPPSFRIENLLVGDEKYGYVNLMRDASYKGDLYLEVKKKGKYAQNIQIPDVVIIPKTENSVKVSFLVQARDLEPGDYSTDVFFMERNDAIAQEFLRQINEGDQEGEVRPQLNISKGVKLRINFSIVDTEEEKYSLSNLVIKKSKTNPEFLIGSYNIKNNGNTPLQVPDFRIELKHKYLSYYKYNDLKYSLNPLEQNRQSIKPGLEQKIKFKLSASDIRDCDLNTYDVQADFYQKDKLSSSLFSIFSYL